MERVARRKEKTGNDVIIFYIKIMQRDLFVKLRGYSKHSLSQDLEQWKWISLSSTETSFTNEMAGDVTEW